MVWDQPEVDDDIESLPERCEKVLLLDDRELVAPDEWLVVDRCCGWVKY